MTANHEERVRYPETADPVTTDGRDVDSAMAVLGGEAAQQCAEHSDWRLESIAPAPWDRVPEITGADPSYYDRPMLKPSVWSLDIPVYYFLGGAAGASLVLGAALQLMCPVERREVRRLAAVCHWIGIAGSTGGAAFLVHDLGRPLRFLYMMRVFRPTSVMNMGVWILSGAAPTAIATGLLINRRGWPGAIGELCGYLSGIFGAALAGYTGVLVSATAIPVWQASRRWVPVMFMASSAASAASVLEIASGSEPARRAAIILGTAGRAAELAAARRVEQVASVVPKVGEPFRRGGTAVLWKAAALSTAASLALSLAAGKSRKRAVAAGVLGVAGSLCLRLAVHYISAASARDPRAAFHQQRAGATC